MGIRSVEEIWLTYVERTSDSGTNVTRSNAASIVKDVTSRCLLRRPGGRGTDRSAQLSKSSRRSEEEGQETSDSKSHSQS